MKPVKHSPEPWKVDNSFTPYVYAQGADLHCIQDGNDQDLIEEPVQVDDYPMWVNKADPERIVACVNFCKGIPTQVLEAKT